MKDYHPARVVRLSVTLTRTAALTPLESAVLASVETEPVLDVAVELTVDTLTALESAVEVRVLTDNALLSAVDAEVPATVAEETMVELAADPPADTPLESATEVAVDPLTALELTVEVKMD